MRWFRFLDVIVEKNETTHVWLLSSFTWTSIGRDVDELLHIFHNLVIAGGKTVTDCCEVFYSDEFSFGFDMCLINCCTFINIWDVEQIYCASGFGSVRTYCHLPLAGMACFLFLSLDSQVTHYMGLRQWYFYHLITGRIVSLNSKRSAIICYILV